MLLAMVENEKTINFCLIKKLMVFIYCAPLFWRFSCYNAKVKEGSYSGRVREIVPNLHKSEAIVL
jgi:hypothetical protein